MPASTLDRTPALAPVMVLRAYRYALDPTADQLDGFAQHAGTARWAFNHALAVKQDARHLWHARVAELVDGGMDEAAARAAVRVPTPRKPEIQRALNAVKGDETVGREGPCAWWRSVSTYAIQSALADADTAYDNWLASRAGRRAGRAVGPPRFKSRRRSRPSFRLHHNAKKPTIRLTSYRRLLLPRLGEVRLHESGKKLARRVQAGTAVIQAVTISRGGQRWYASVLVRETIQVPAAPSRRQQTAGTVGVDLGVHSYAALSTGELIPNPRTKAAHARRLTRASRAYARTQPGSKRREKARRRLARLQHLEAQHRAGHAHALTKRLATGWASVAIEDLHVAGMTRSARGTLQRPGTNVRAKTGLNRAVLDVALGELRRQLSYKTVWYGSTLAVLDRWYPSSKTCSTCGAAKAKLGLAERTYRCESCGMVMDRDVNAARNIATHAVPVPPPSTTCTVNTDGAVAPGKGEMRNARRAAVRPEHPRVHGHAAPKREGPESGSPRRSDPPASPHAGTAAAAA